VVLGDECRIQGGAYIADGCILGNQVFVGPNATLLNDRYPPSGNKALWQPISVQDGAVIGGNATVVPGCDIGKNSVLAAGAVLTKHLPEEEVWAGNPAKFMMKRSDYESKR
jgi:acetyltransferase-like isoleucine patch superfamily enzyme